MLLLFVLWNYILHHTLYKCSPIYIFAAKLYNSASSGRNISLGRQKLGGTSQESNLATIPLDNYNITNKDLSLSYLEDIDYDSNNKLDPSNEEEDPSVFLDAQVQYIPSSNDCGLSNEDEEYIQSSLHLTAFKVRTSGEVHQKGIYIGEVITWSIFNLLHPLYAACMY